MQQKIFALDRFHIKFLVENEVGLSFLFVIFTGKLYYPINQQTEHIIGSAHAGFSLICF